MKNLILTFLFLNLSFSAAAQVNLDSLFTIWNDTSLPDTSRLQAIQTIAWDGYRFNNPDSAFYFAQLEYDLAESTGHKKWMVEALNTQGTSFITKGEPDQAFESYSQSLTISKEIRYKKGIRNALTNIGSIYYRKGDLSKALEYYFQGLEISKEMKDKKRSGQIFANIGVILIKQGDLSQALDYLNRGAKLSEEVGDFQGKASAKNFIATTYLELGDYEAALSVYSENLAFYGEVGRKDAVAGTLNNIANIYVKLGDDAKAIEYLKKALKTFEELGIKPGVAGISASLGKRYFERGDYKLALKYCNTGLEFFEERGNKGGIANIIIVMGSIYAAQGHHTKAISYGKRGLAILQEIGEFSSIGTAAQNLFSTYKAAGKYKEALEMNELYFQVRDSLESEENQKAAIQLQVQSEYEKQKAIDDLENEKRVAIETQKKENQQKLSIAIGIGLLLISFLALVIFNRLKVTRQQKAIIEEQKKKVEQSEKYKEQFLANMSHEIRTPMHAISGMVKILERNEHPPSQDVFLHAMKTSSDNLVVILNDVLDLSKIEAGKLDIESIPTSPVAVIENVTQILKFKAEEKGLQLNYQIDEEVPELIMGDPTRLNQILINLAGNAIKFTEKGNVNILLRKENDRLKFIVKDTGIGIPKEKVEKIFGAFEQAKDSTTRSYGGTGLGLSISKQLVELQNGKIWAESEEGQGSTFFIELPLVIAASNAINEGIITEDKLKKMTTSLEGIRVLLAEDNPFNQMIAQDDLSFFIKNIKIDVVENGALAVEKFKTGNYDLILMDVQMPVMNGFEATRKIREIEKSEGKETAIPIIAMTASLLKSEVDNCYNSGMNNYIPKPYKSEELIAPIFSEMKR